MVENKIAVDRNHQALKRILASLVAMAGWTATGGTFLRACSDAGNATTLPRHLLCRHPAALASGRSRHAAAGHRAFARHFRHAAAAASGQAKARTGVPEGWQRHRHRRHRHLPLQAGSRQCPATPSTQTRRLSHPPYRLPAARSAAQSLPPPPPHKAEHRRATLPARLHRAECHSGAISRRPTIPSTPRVSVSALLHLPRRWTTCRPRRSALRAGKPEQTGRAK